MMQKIQDTEKNYGLNIFSYFILKLVKALLNKFEDAFSSYF